MVAALLYLSSTADAADRAKIRIRNFAEVNEHLLRGGQPSAIGLRDLAAAHVSSVLDLRESGASTAAERQQVEQLGMKYIQVPLPAWRSATKSEIERILSILTPDDNGTVFVHCWRGKDRTGTVIACYRIQHDGWNARRALQEAKLHGMSRVQRSMEAFIMGFKPVDLPRSPN